MARAKTGISSENHVGLDTDIMNTVAVVSGISGAENARKMRESRVRKVPKPTTFMWVCGSRRRTTGSTFCVIFHYDFFLFFNFFFPHPFVVPSTF